MCIGWSNSVVPVEAGELKDLDAAAQLARKVIQDEIEQARRGGEPQYIAEPITTYTGIPQQWTLWTGRR
jgi:hypothetical protein